MKKEELFEVMNDMDDDIIRKAKMYRKKRIKRYIKAIVAVAASVCIVMSLPVATALGYNMPYSILYTVSPKIAQTFKPIEESCEDNGIKMEVVSVSIEGSKAIFLISIQGDNIGEKADLFDSYYINCPFDSSCGINLKEFDESTKTAYFLVYVETINGEAINKDKVTFGCKQIIPGKHKYSGVISDVDLKNVPTNLVTDVISTENDLYRGVSGYATDDSITEYAVLANKENLFTPVKGAAITAIGYVDNALHVQVHYDDIHHTDNHGFIYLVDENGNEYDDKRTTVVTFWDENYKNYKNYKNYDEMMSMHYGCYYETIIDIPYNELEKYDLYGYFLTSDGYLSGDWEVTFKVE